MPMRNVITTAALTLSMVALGGTSAQQPTPPTPLLDALDYLEIEQLVYRYGFALDTGADNGFAYADLYAPDATFTGTNQGPTGRTYQGRDRLAALSRGGKRGPNFVSHYVTNVVIEPAPGGAVGRTYVGILDIGNGGNGAKSKVDHGGLYNDVYVKTPQGWRFKSRSFFESTSGAPVQPPPAMLDNPRALRTASTSSASAKTPGSSSRLTAEDYIEIQQLVSRYPYALDQNPDEGLSYANLFTPDAVFRQPRTEGRQNLATMASRAPHGPKYTRHFLANHVIEATAEGAVGKQYLVAVDIGEMGQPSSIFLGGHYEDVYAKTPDGWRFKTRTFVASATATAADAK
jgi:actinorhodin biosynthesis protein ActVIA